MVDTGTLERGLVDAPRAAMDQRDLVERAGRGDHDAFSALVNTTIVRSSRPVADSALSTRATPSLMASMSRVVSTRCWLSTASSLAVNRGLLRTMGGLSLTSASLTLGGLGGGVTGVLAYRAGGIEGSWGSFGATQRKQRSLAPSLPMKSAAQAKQ